MNPIEGMAALIVAVVIVITAQACQTYRDCRGYYKFTRAFCASVVLP